MSSAMPAASADVCVLVSEGLSRARIHLTDGVFRHCKDAVREWVRGVSKATGVRVYIDGSAVFARCLEPPRAAAVLIRFILSSDTALGKDGFCTRVTVSSLEIEACSREGFLNAVYAFLEQHCGFRWFWPGADGEVYRKLDRLALPIGEHSEVPDYHWRHLLLADMPLDDDTRANKWQVQEFHMHPSETALCQMREWLQRNRMGGLRVVVGHTWGRFVSPEEFGRDHPEYFAEVNGSRQVSLATFDGKHGGQLCTSNPAVIDMLVRRVREHFDRYPEVDVISISPNDGTGFCECDACIARDVFHGNPPPLSNTSAAPGLAAAFRDDGDRSSGSGRITGPITDRMFEFANTIGAAIGESHPDKKLLLLVYSLYRAPPRKVTLSDNIIAQFCVSCHQHWEPSLRDADREAITELGRMARHTGIYEYFDQGAWPGLTRSFPDLIVESTRMYHHCGVRHYSAQASTGFAANGINLWVLSRSLWNTSVDAGALLDEYCTRAFGAAAKPMRRYVELWRGRWQFCKGLTQMGGGVPGSGSSGVPLSPVAQLLQLYPAAFMADVEDAFATAQGRVSADSAERRRIDFWGQALVGARLLLAAAAASTALSERGWPMRSDRVTPEAIEALGPAAEIRAQANAVRDLWSRWEGFLEATRDEFVFSFFWARYCYDSRRSLHPHNALQNIVEILDREQPPDTPPLGAC